MTHLRHSASGHKSPHGHFPHVDAALNLFGGGPPLRYPHILSKANSATSMLAARGIAGHARSIREAVLAEYRAAHPQGLSAEVAGRLNESILTVRPRVSELRCLGMLEPTPETARNAISGHATWVLRATSKAMEAGTTSTTEMVR